MASLDSMTKKIFFVKLLFWKFKEKVKGLLGDSKTIEYYTPHGISHIKGVEFSINYLLSFQGKDQIRSETDAVVRLVESDPLELLLLKLCAWGHDLGMIQKVAKKFAKTHKMSHKYGDRDVENQEYRDYHDNASAYYIREELPAIIEMLKDQFKSGLKDSDGTHKLTPDECKDEIRNYLKREGRVFELSEGEEDEANRLDQEIEEFLAFITDKFNYDYLQAEALALAHTVNLVARYHRRAENLDQCPDERFLLGKQVRAKLLAAVFRLADALHVDRTRFTKETFDAFRSSPYFTEENRTHWIKSYIISSIRIDASHFTINIQADLPAESSNEMEADSRFISTAKIKEMLNFVVYDLGEDVLSVSRILLRHAFPPLLGVNMEIHPIPEMGYSEDIKQSLDNLLAAASPNTSQLIEIAMNGLNSRLEQSRNQFDKELENNLVKFAKSHISVIEQQLEKRPCHEGLWKIKDLLLKVSRLWDLEVEKEVENAMNTLSGCIGGDGHSRSRLIWTLLESMYQVFLAQRKKVEEGAKSQEIIGLFNEYSNIIVYGYSQQVIALLTSFFSKPHEKEDKVSVHVLECRTKTLYTATGQLIYLDAQRYAERLKQELKHIEDISIEPDVAVGTIIQRTENKKTAILLGSNAVYQDGTFVHSMGHLTIAAVAKAGLGEAEVIVVTDGMKIGAKKVKSKDHPHERNPEKWLTPNKNITKGLISMGIHLHNWQEDHVPRNLIDKLIVLDTREVLESTSDDFLNKLKSQRFNPRKEYCDDLECHLVAAMVAQPGLDEPLRQLINERYKNNDENHRNWLCAEEFLRLKAEKAKKGNLPEEVEKDPLFEWMNARWTANEAGAVKKLTKYIQKKKGKDGGNPPQTD